VYVRDDGSFHNKNNAPKEITSFSLSMCSLIP
jgi:hypothetical protein